RVAVDTERDPDERPAARRAGDALAGLGQVVRAVRRALHEAAVLREELVLDPVEAHRHVTAPIDVRMVLARVVQDEPLDLLAVAREEELLRLPRPELAEPRDRDRHARTTRR